MIIRFKMALELKKCCCLDLRSGAFIAGCLLFVAHMSVLVPITFGVGFIAIVNIMGNSTALLTIAGSVDVQTRRDVFLARIFLPIALIVIGTNVILNIALLGGIQKKNSEYVAKYVKFAPVFIIIYITALISHHLNGASSNDLTVFGIILLVIAIYFTLVIRSYYLTMDKPEKIPEATETVSYRTLKLKSFCFITDLKLSSLIIASLSLIANVALIVTSLIVLGVIVFLNADGSHSRKINQNIQELLYVALTVVSIFLVTFIANLVVTSALLIGLQKDKRGHIKTYLICAPIFITTFIMMLIYNIVNGAPLIGTFTFVVLILILTYFALVIGSYYLTLDDADKKLVVIKIV